MDSSRQIFLNLNPPHCPDPEHPGTPVLHVGQFSRGKGHFVPLEYKPSAELPDKEYPLLLTTGRNLFHWHSGTMTRRVGGLNELLGEGWGDISPSDAEKLGIAHGDRVKITSRRGSILARANITEVSDKGVVYMNMHFAESAANVLTSPALDPVAKIPEFKVSSIRAILTVLERAAEDNKFLAALAENPAGVLESYDLTPEHRDALVYQDIAALEKWVGPLDERLHVWLKARLKQENI